MKRKTIIGSARVAGLRGAKRDVLIPGMIEVGGRYHQERAWKMAMDRAENAPIGQTVKTPAGTFEHSLKTGNATLIEPGRENNLYSLGIRFVPKGKLRLVEHGFVKK